MSKSEFAWSWEDYQEIERETREREAGAKPRVTWLPPGKLKLVRLTARPKAKRYARVPR